MMCDASSVVKTEGGPCSSGEVVMMENVVYSGGSAEYLAVFQ